MKEKVTYLKKSWKYLKTAKNLFFFVCLLGFIYAGLSAILPILSAKIVTAITDNLIAQIFSLSFLLLGVYLLDFFVSAAIDNLYYRYVGKVNLEIQKDMARSILNLEVKNFDENNSGVFIKRLDTDPYEITNIFNSLRNALTRILTNLAIFVLIYTINIYVGLFFTFSLIVIYVIQKKRVDVFNKNWHTFREVDDKTSGIFQEILKGTRDIKALGLKEPFIEYTSESLNKSYRKNLKLSIQNNFFWTLSQSVENLSTFFFLLLGTYLMMNHMLKATDFIILYMYKDQLYSLIEYLSHFVGDLNEFSLAAKRIFDITDYHAFSKEQFGKKHIKKVQGNIEFKDVTFGYNEYHNVLQNLNLTIHANDTIAIVGKSGEGKTTLFSLLSRLYDTKQGDILIDGTSLYELDEETIRQNISIITQNPYIFNMTIKENLKLVNPNITDEEMIEKCKLAALHDYIETLPDKYDTLIGEGGVNLSGGQKQRLAIARALVKDSEIILFDEATSALDNETQTAIQTSIQNISKDYTILIIAHRLSTIEFCNRIIVLHDGKVNGIGTHEELLKKNKIYQELYKK